METLVQYQFLKGKVQQAKAETEAEMAKTARINSSKVRYNDLQIFYELWLVKYQFLKGKVQQRS